MMLTRAAFEACFKTSSEDETEEAESLGSPEVEGGMMPDIDAAKLMENLEKLIHEDCDTIKVCLAQREFD
jgi:hypothetical protein